MLRAVACLLYCKKYWSVRVKRAGGRAAGAVGKIVEKNRYRDMNHMIGDIFVFVRAHKHTIK